MQVMRRRPHTLLLLPRSQCKHVLARTATAAAAAAALHLLQVLPDDFSIEDTALFYARAAAVNWDAQLVGWRIKYTTLHW